MNAEGKLDESATEQSSGSDGSDQESSLPEEDAMATHPAGRGRDAAECAIQDMPGPGSATRPGADPFARLMATLRSAR